MKSIGEFKKRTEMLTFENDSLGSIEVKTAEHC